MLGMCFVMRGGVGCVCSVSVMRGGIGYVFFQPDVGWHWVCVVFCQHDVGWCRVCVLSA